MIKKPYKQGEKIMSLVELKKTQELGSLKSNNTSPTKINTSEISEIFHFGGIEL